MAKGSEPMVIRYGPSHSGVIRYGPAVRRFPRIQVKRTQHYWQATWLAQNDSRLSQEADTRIGAIVGVLRWARYQGWPLYMRPGWDNRG